MKKKVKKPSTEAKALSLFLMAYKAKDPMHKEQSKRINRLWDLVKDYELTNEEYQEEVVKMLDAHGGYATVVEKTVRFYIEEKGGWKSEGEDTYSADARKIAQKITNEKASPKEAD